MVEQQSSIGIKWSYKRTYCFNQWNQVQHNVGKLTCTKWRNYSSPQMKDQATLRLVTTTDKDLSLLDFLRDFGSISNLDTILCKRRDRKPSRSRDFIYRILTYQIYNQWTSYDIQDRRRASQIGGADQWGITSRSWVNPSKVEGLESRAYRLTISIDVKIRYKIREISWWRCGLTLKKDNTIRIKPRWPRRD